MRKILIVDDDQIVLGLFEQLLKARGCDAIVAGSAEEALKALSPDVAVVISDVQMDPGKDGIWLLEEIRKRNKNLAVILMSACVESDKVQQAEALGVTDFIQKPFSWRALVMNLMTYLQSDGGFNVKKCA